MRRILPLKQEYFDWLCVQAGTHKRPGYIKLSRQLNQKIFRWSVLNDDNRCQDGIGLREQFIGLKELDESHLEVQHFMKAQCSVLEMLVALARRMNDLMYNLNDHDDRTPKWFMELITNLDLHRFTDHHSPGMRHSPVDEAHIDEVLEVMMERTYDYYGRGGLFPLKRRPPENQTGVEIWYQLMRYLDENYGL